MSQYCCWLLLFFCVHYTARADQPELRLLTGTVVDESDQPIIGALVEWGHFGAAHDARESVLTDGEGRFRLETRKYGPDFRLGASAKGWGPRWHEHVIPTTMDAPEPHSLKLLKPVEVTGKVVDDDGKPIEGAVVIAVSESRGFNSRFSMPTPSYPFPGPSHQATTARDGSFTISHLPQRAASHFIARKPDPNPAVAQDEYGFSMYVKSGTGRMPRGKALPGEPVIIRIAREYATDSIGTGMLKARVRDKNNDRPVNRFQVVRRHIPKMVPQDSPTGEFSIDQLIIGRPYQVFVYADGYAPFVFREAAQAKSDAKVIDCPLQRSCGLRAVVVDESGSPVEGAEIVAGVPGEYGASRFQWDGFRDYVDGHHGWETVQRATTDRDGRFRICEGASKNALAILAPGCARQFIGVDERPAADEHGVMTIRMQNECRLKVHVKKDGQPEPMAHVHLSQTDARDLDFGSLSADAEGYFEIGQLRPGEYRLSVYQRSGNTATTRLSRMIKLQPNEILSLEMEKADGPFTLRGKTPPFALIDLRAEAEQIYSSMGTVADVNGHYRIEGLRKGHYQISLHQSSALGGHSGRDRGTAINIEGDMEYNVASPFMKLFGPQ